MDWGLKKGFDWILFGNDLSTKSEANVTSLGTVGEIDEIKKGR